LKLSPQDPKLTKSSELYGFLTSKLSPIFHRPDVFLSRNDILTLDLNSKLVDLVTTVDSASEQLDTYDVG
jgi:hypothetical protein